MGHSRHRSVRSWFASIAIAAAAASGLAVIGAVGAAATTGKIVVGPNSGTPISEVTEGDSTGSTTVGQFGDTGNTTECVPTNYAATIDWGDGKTSTGTISCQLVGPAEGATVAIYDVKGSHVYDDSDNGAESNKFQISLTVTAANDWTSTAGTANTDTATISDADLSVDQANGSGEGHSFTAVEGQAVEVKVAVFDNNNSVPDPVNVDVSATVDWGDGTVDHPTPVLFPSSQGEFCDFCDGDAFIDVTHKYDAIATAYSIKVTATDDGGATVSQSFTATISDGALTAGTAKTLSTTATKASTQVVASFTDAAGPQASAADFAASINWGDSTTSSGSVSQTASGGFNVSGTHTFAAAGTKTVTVTVTDQEGKTATMTATVHVSAAPVVLPATGEPQQPAAPAWAIYLALLILGFAFVGGGLIGAKSRKA